MKNSTQQLLIEDLKSIRKKQDMSVDSVAGMMKVSKDFVHHIESGNFEKLGAPTFLRGHITNYCKALNLEPQEVLAQIPSQFLQHQQLQTSNAMGASPLARVRRQSNHFGKYAVGTALLGMLCLSFYFVWDKWSLSHRPEAVNSIAISQNGDNTEEQITYSSLIPQVTGPKQTKQVESSDVTAQDKNGQTDSANETEAVDEATTEDLNQTNLDDQHEPVLNDGDAVETASNEYVIKLDLKEQVWVSIKTQTGDSIVQDLLGPGVNEYSADEPLKFRIGNAQNLKLSINNKNVELAPHTDKDVADFEWPLQPRS